MKRFYIHFLFVSLVAVFSFVIFAGKANAGSSPTVENFYDIHGWAWSSNVGWVSLNYGDSGAGGGPYKVEISDKGNFRGYGWSSNVGWVSFEPTDILGCSVSGSSATQAKLNTQTGEISGFIRVLSGKGRTDGWDGCVELAGINHASFAGGSQGLVFDIGNNSINGYAWGDAVVGWLQFVTVTCPTCNFNVVQNPTLLITNCAIGAPVTNANYTTVSITTGINSSNGTAPYTYTLVYGDASANGVVNSSNITQSFSHTYTRGASTAEYIPSYTVVDSSVPQKSSGVQVCGSVSVPGKVNATGIILWADSSSGGVDTYVPSSGTEAASKVTRVRSGKTVVVKYKNVGDDVTGCLGYSLPPTDTSKITAWLSNSISSLNSSERGSYSLSSMQKGSYKLLMRCVDSTGKSIPSNTVQIEVSDALQSEK